MFSVPAQYVDNGYFLQNSTNAAVQQETIRPEATSPSHSTCCYVVVKYVLSSENVLKSKRTSRRF